MVREPIPDHPRGGFARLIRFGIVGSFNTLLDFVLLFIFVLGIGLNTYLGNVLSTGICLVVSFFLNKRWTFRSREDSGRQFVRFLVVTLAGLWVVQNVLIWAVSRILTQFASDAVVLLAAKAVATLGSLTWNYLLYSRFVFHD